MGYRSVGAFARCGTQTQGPKHTHIHHCSNESPAAAREGGHIYTRGGDIIMRGTYLSERGYFFKGERGNIYLQVNPHHRLICNVLSSTDLPVYIELWMG